MALNWEQVQKNIFSGESGGDYDALFGYQNRPDGLFSNIKVSQMPVGDVIKFTSPSGEYGQYVKSKVGHVATPVGAYQVVGSTLREAVNALGIDPNQRFDRATQDRIGKYILKTQGTGAWEGYGKGGAMMANQANQANQPSQQQSQGLLGGILGGQGIGGALGMSDDFRDRLKMAILLGSDPRGFAPMVSAIEARGKERRALSRTTAQANATADYLERTGQVDLANLLRQGGIDAAAALNAAAKAPKVSEAEKQIARLMETGIDRTTAIKIRDGRLKISRNPVTQRAELIDMATGNVIGQATETLAQVAGVEEPVPADDRFKDLPVTQAGGLAGWGANIANIVTDALGAGQQFSKIGEAQAAMTDLSTRTVLMLDADFAGKPTNFTREKLEKLTIKPAELSQGSVQSYQKTLNMVNALEEAVSGVNAVKNNSDLYSPQAIKDAQANSNKLQNLLDDYISLKNAFESKGLGSQGKVNGQPTVEQTDQDRALIGKYLTPNYYRDNMLPSPQ
jgi:hypothetical protein